MVESRRHPPGACGIGSQRKGHQPGRNRNRRSRAGTAADIGQIIDIARRPVRAAATIQPGGELIEIGLADADRPCRKQPLDNGRRCRRPKGKAGASSGGIDPRNIDIVLHRKRHTGKRQHLSGRNTRIDSSGGSKQCVGFEPRNPRLRLNGIVNRQTAQYFAHDRHSGNATAADIGGNRAGIKPREFGHEARRKANIGAPG